MTSGATPGDVRAKEMFFGALELSDLRSALVKGAHIAVSGIAGSAGSFVLAGLVRDARPMLAIVAHIDEADECVEELRSLGIDATVFPAVEVLPGESNPSAELIAARLSVLRSIAAGGMPKVVVAPIAALMQAVPTAQRLEGMVREVCVGDRIPQQSLVAWLSAGGYERVESVEKPGDFAVRGGLLDVHPTTGSAPLRIDFFGDEVERIFEIDLATQASDRKVERVTLLSASLTSVVGEQLVGQREDEGTRSFSEWLPQHAIAVFVDLAEIVEQARAYWDRVRDSRGVFGPPATIASITKRASATLEMHSGAHTVGGGVTLPFRMLASFSDDIEPAFTELAELASTHTLLLCCENEGELARTRDLLSRHAPSTIAEPQLLHVQRGFLWEPSVGRAIAFVPMHEVLHRAVMRRRGRGLGGTRAKDVFLSFDPGDYVVHRDHGIARFLGLTLSMQDPTEAGGKPVEVEFLTLEFDAGAKILVPAARIEVVQRYIGAGAAKPKLSTLGGKRWKRSKEEALESVQDLASEMLRVQAARGSTPGIAYPSDSEWQRNFEAEFPYDETEDQITAIAATKRDMERSRPMDRLVCGDVGFGKTEIAIRAAFKVVDSGRQTALLVPTTVLAEQHEQSFRDRFRAYPFRVESLSRFKTDAEQRVILEATAKGDVDILIGTHRILSKDVRFKDLGLIVVDEEQRFGVEHKQRLLEFRVTADVLTLSATPIPRTLHMAMLGLRDISSLTTPPADRRAIVTEVIPWNERRIQQALQRELAREGQAFIVHNRITDLRRVADAIQALVPKARIVIGHGQMEPKELEDVMLRFMRHQADILVSTTIIESGLDIPTANTMVISNAHMFGLAELHQLRGRVGRWKHRAYCYLCLPEGKPPTQDALKRLRAIEDFSMLGAGFKIAMRDLELRGAGNLLGAEQSGHIAAVGYEMYCQLLEDAVGALRNEERLVPIDTVLDIGLAGAIPRAYIPSDARRLDAYRRIGGAASIDILKKHVADLTSAYGEPPPVAVALFDFAEIRLRATLLGVKSIHRRGGDVIFRTTRPKELEQRFAGIQGTVRVPTGRTDDGVAEVWLRPPPSFLEVATLVTVLRKRLSM